MSEIERRRLDVLAEKIADEMRLADESWRDAVGHAINAGEKLIEAKSLCKHGEWSPWLEKNFEGTGRTARNYMRLASNRQRVSHLSTVRDALAHLTAPKSAPDEDDEEAELGPSSRRLLRRLRRARQSLQLAQADLHGDHLQDAIDALALAKADGGIRVVVDELQDDPEALVKTLVAVQRLAEKCKHLAAERTLDAMRGLGQALAELEANR